MSNYLFVEMKNNAFYCSMCLSILNDYYESIRVKVDTGCNYSTIPFHKLKNDDILCRRYKEEAIKSNVKMKQSYGVESGGLRHDKPQTFSEKLDCSALKFKHNMYNCSLEGYPLPDIPIYVNYDRHGNILIGMDILSLFDIHMGISLKTGKETLIAVLKSQQDKADYNKALYEHFNLVEGTSTVAKGLRKIWRR